MKAIKPITIEDAMKPMSYTGPGDLTPEFAARAVVRGDILVERVRELEDAITKVLNDESSAKGWGPDVTTLGFLKDVVAPKEKDNGI